MTMISHQKQLNKGGILTGLGVWSLVTLCLPISVRASEINLQFSKVRFPFFTHLSEGHSTLEEQRECLTKQIKVKGRVIGFRSGL